MDGQAAEVQAVDRQTMQVQAQAIEDQAECQCPGVELDPSRHGGETLMVPEHFDLPEDRYDESEAYLK